MIGNIHSIETMGLLDGPGIRVVIFMQGCPLRCLFCHNPETWSTSEQILMSPEEVVNLVIKYKSYFSLEGGVTFSGGEPLMQPEFLLETLKLCKKYNIHTCLDTAGIGGSLDKEILDYTDLVLFDIKAIEENSYFKITGNNIDTSLQFLKLCQKMNKKLWLRQVIVPTINDAEDYILKLKEFIKPIKNVEKIELLPYHTLGIDKYTKLNLVYRLSGIKEMNKNECERFNKLLINE